MKRILLSLTILLTYCASVNAQGIQIYNTSGTENIVGDTITFWHPVDPNVVENDFSHTGFAKIVNESVGTMTIKLRRVERQIINGTKDYLCWGITCFGKMAAGDSVDWYVDDQAVVAPNDTAGGTGLVVYLEANDMVGEAVYEYLFYDSEDPNVTASTFVRWSISLLTDINDIANAVQKMEVYPNPASDQFTIDLNAGIQAQNQEIIVRDMLGKIVIRNSISSAQEKFNFSTEGMNKGIYFVSYSIDGEVLKTSKLVIR